MLPDLSSLPGWAQVLAYICFASALGLISALGVVGYRRGQKNPPRGEQVEIAAVTLDSRAVREVADEARGLKETLAETNGLIRGYLADQERQRDAAALEAARREGYEEGLSSRTPHRAPRRRIPKMGN